MKKLILSLTILLTTHLIMAQQVLSNAPFEKEWKSIDEALSNGLPQSAQTLLEGLATELPNLDNEPLRTAHHLKSLLYTLGIETQLTESGEWQSIRRMESKWASAEGMEKTLLAFYLAQQYHQYYQQNAWTINERTFVSGSSPTEEETSWSSADFLARINTLFQEVMDDVRLRDVAFATISPLIVSPSKENATRPTLYDILLYQVLTYYTQNDAFVGEPQYETALDNVHWLADASEFIRLDLPTSDQPTAQYRMLSLFQSALRYDLANRPTSMAYLMLDLHRLRWVYNYLQSSNKHEAYLAALGQLRQRMAGSSQEAEVMAAIVTYHYERGQSYNAETPNDTLRWSLKKAKDLAQELAQQYPKTAAAQDALSIIGQIESPSLEVQMETVLLPNDAGLVSVSWNNVDKVYFRIVAIDADFYHSSDIREKVLQSLVSRKPVLSWQQELPQAGDYRDHRTEVSFKGLPKGVYSLLVSTREDFHEEKGVAAYVHFWVSELALLTEGSYWNANRLMVVNRRNGQPVEKAAITLWGYANRWNRDKLTRLGDFTTDANGIADINVPDQVYGKISIQTANDHLYLDEDITVSSRIGIERENVPYAVFFLDRGIYRPGQQVHFKVLALRTTKEGLNEIVPNQSFSVTLQDANSQDVASLTLQTNSFGTAAGVFTLPQSGLLGQMGLRTDLGRGNTQRFRVEEYKRPRFEVAFQALEGGAALGDTLEVKGTALGYSGPAVADAKVTYTVTRKTWHPYWRWHFRGYFPPPSSEPQTIATGTVMTDAQGQFSIVFPAEPDASLEQENLAQFTFSVHVDVTDITGETHAADKQVMLSRYPYNLDISMETRCDRKDALSATLRCTNLEGQPVSQPVQVAVFRKQAPERTQIQRFWSLPDMPVMREKDFRKQFPLLAFRQNELPGNYEIGRRFGNNPLL
ncbi:MAG: MG2 domain-containing protein [Saprospiraceae bacterium]